MEYNVNTFIEKAKYYVGYLEKESNKDLDDFTANAGDKNYTRFCRDYEIYTGKKGYLPSAWCAEFVSCVLVESFGLEAAKKLLCGELVCSCTICRNQFKDNNLFFTSNPQKGDIVLFYNSSKTALAHCGIVIEVTSSTIKTVEGNTSSGDNVIIENGGAVAEKKYFTSNAKIAGYCRIDFDGKGSQNMNEYIKKYQEWLNKNYKSNLDVDGSYGSLTKKASIKALQEYINTTFGTSLSKDGVWGSKTKKAACTLRKTYKCKGVYILQGVLYGLGYDPDGFDGSYGPGCEKAVKEFQSKKSLNNKDGICDYLVWEKMFK